MTVAARTGFVESDDYYTRPETPLSRIANITATVLATPKDHDGHVRAPVVPEIVAPAPGESESDGLANAIRSVAAGLGVDAVALADSDSFIKGVSDLDATDIVTITTLVQDAVARNPRIATFTMRPNAAQGANSMPPSTPQSAFERVRAAIANRSGRLA
jgi:hypothetical protein